MLPETVLERAASEMLCYQDSGMSVMEMSHRSPVYEKIISDAESLLREVMQIPDNYKVLFLQGGASTQFAAVPLNLLRKSGKADYILSGQFSTKAYQEAQKYGDIVAVASSKAANFSYVPRVDKSAFREDADYVHICFNNTIYGTKFPYIPDTGDIGGGYVVVYFKRTVRRFQIRRYLCRRAKEHGACRAYGSNYP